VRAQVLLDPLGDPSGASLTRTVAPVVRSCTNTSCAKFLSGCTRFVAKEPKATRLPSPPPLTSLRACEGTGFDLQPVSLSALTRQR
jgi:hypothetical protein